MLIHLYPPAKGEGYRATVLRRRKLAVGFLVLGLITLAVALILGASDRMPNDFTAGFYVGVGSGIIVASIMGLIFLNGLLKDEKKLRAKEVQETDERVQLVNLKAASTTGAVILVLLYVGILVLAAFSKALTGVLLAAIFLVLGVFMLARVYYNKKL